MYNWKNTSSSINKVFQTNHWFPYNVPFKLLRIIPICLAQLFKACAIHRFIILLRIVFALSFLEFEGLTGVKTPYVKAQTLTLMAIQCIPLFILPQIVLPWMGYNGWFEHGVGKSFADALFPIVQYGHGREYWRASGLILAWPLFIWNVFTGQPLWWWLGISFAQTFVIIPLIIFTGAKALIADGSVLAAHWLKHWAIPIDKKCRMDRFGIV